MAARQIDIDEQVFDIYYEVINQEKEKAIVFLHGWGSSKNIMKQAFSGHLKDFKHIYIDMPGFGQSNNDYSLNTADYAKILSEFLDQLEIDIDIIVGHSFGGKVATLLNPKTLVLLSSSGILEDKSFTVKSKIKLAKLFNLVGLSFLSKGFRSKDVQSMSAPMYETFKNVVDEDFSKQFIKFKNKTFVFSGEDDKTTSLESGRLISQLIKNSEFKSFGGDHYFFLLHSGEISKDIETK